MKSTISQTKKVLINILPALLKELIKTNIRLILESLIRKRNRKKLIKIVKQKEISKKHIWIEIGSIIQRENWITVDISKGADICWDLSLPFPLKDNIIDKIYTSHLLEHFHYQELLQLLKELKRILKSGRELSICVPDAKIFVNAYLKNDLEKKKELDRIKHFEHPVEKIDFINYIAYMGGVHKYMFETENIISILKHVGYKKVVKRNFQPDLDLKVRKDESIYISAFK